MSTAEAVVPSPDPVDSPSACSFADEVSRLDLVLADLDEARGAAARSGRFGFDEPWAVFIRKMRLLTPQAYGGRIQNWLMKFYGWARVAAAEDRGDVKDSSGDYWEIKVTLITASNPDANFVQLRPHQDIAGYELFVVDTDYSVTRFQVPKSAMAQEIDALGQSAHGTKTATRGNTNREYAIRFPWASDNAIVQRWKLDYEVPSRISDASSLPSGASRRKGHEGPVRLAVPGPNEGP
jgi:hypothetical protein